MRAWFLAVVLGVIAIAPVLLVGYYYRGVGPSEKPIASVRFEDENPHKKMEPGAEFEVRACKVIDGFRFEMYLEGGKWIEAHLPVATKDEASQVVVEWLNKTTPPSPTVTLRRQVGNVWIVDFHLQVDGKRSSILDLLRAKGLLL